MPSLKVYGKPNCKWCGVAKEYLDEYQYSYQYIDLSEKKNRKARKLMSDLDMKYLPVFIYGDNVKSFSTKSEYMFKERLQELLEEYGIKQNKEKG